MYATLALDDGGRKRVSFSVPTGNFGDIFAGYLALKMGLPIDRLICATNENDILSVFFNTGVYRRGRVHQTISPSMDIQVASNFERFLYLRMDRDSARLRAFMESFAANGEATLDGGMPVDRHIVATAVDTRGDDRDDRRCLQAQRLHRRPAYGGWHRGVAAFERRRTDGVSCDGASGEISGVGRRGHRQTVGAPSHASTR